MSAGVTYKVKSMSSYAILVDWEDFLPFFSGLGILNDWDGSRLVRVCRETVVPM